ncbi:hypothetical protein [Acinetobacter zhairhuonensis]|uniref:hypothetical protein n=1 Tax=Acinetobacter sp. A7.4 TaxID=2919921 RepID=UPI001F4F7C52|nr:hypothetical protein [Acinetobacter sp. A7.4]MCJ8161982.1 hypothetical protein [Acinetobacter sp. A7.4]
MTKDIFSIIGTLGGLSIGTFGLFTWRRQLKGTSEYELSRKAVLKTYEVQQALQAVRDPLLYLSKDEVEARRHLEEEQRIYDKRMSSVYEKWAELQTIRLEAKVIWSDSAHDCFNDIQQCIGKLKGAIWLHFWMKGAYAGPGATIDNNPERIIKNNNIIYFAFENDEFSKQIEESVAKVEKFFSSKIHGE